jgi:hypothetical protein
MALKVEGVVSGGMHAEEALSGSIPPSPLSDRVGYSDHVRFRGYLPVHPGAPLAFKLEVSCTPEKKGHL